MHNYGMSPLTDTELLTMLFQVITLEIFNYFNLPTT